MSAPDPRQSPDGYFLLAKFLFEVSVGIGRVGLPISGLGASVCRCVVLSLCSRACALAPGGRFALGCQFPASLTHPGSGPAQRHPTAFGRRGGEVRRGQVNGSGFRLRRWRRSSRGNGSWFRRCRGVGFDVAGPLAEASGADRLHPVVVPARSRYRAAGVAGLGTGVAVDDVEDLRCVCVGVAAQDGVVGDGLVRRGEPGEGDLIVLRRGLEAGGPGRGVSADVESAVGATSWLRACTVRAMTRAGTSSPARSSGSGARRREAIMTHPKIGGGPDRGR